jgi:hypothetical protein
LLSLDHLAVLDLYLWLERETAVAGLLQVHQSTVSRQLRSALKIMDVRLDARAAHLTLLGDTEMGASEGAIAWSSAVAH